jgi:hypothetical protein
VLAVDPGAGGGMAWTDPDGVVRAEKMPGGMTAVVDLIDDLTMRSVPGVVVWVEKAGTHVRGNSASASAKFARHCGHIEAALYAIGVPARHVPPGTWMRGVFGALPRDKKARKNAIKDEMQRRHPHLRVTLATADALGILEWVREREEGA